VSCGICGREVAHSHWQRQGRSVDLCAWCLLDVRDSYGLVTRSDIEHEVRHDIWEEQDKVLEQRVARERAKLQAEIDRLAGHKTWKTYLIGSAKYVKIGKAYDPPNRLRQLNGKRRGVVCPEDLGSEPLQLLRFVEGDREREMHERFREIHVIGEWFRRTSAVERAFRAAV
jgi:hypothetical protein